MTKNTRITNEIRNEILDALTVQAVKKHAPGLRKRIEAINKAFWEGHCKRLDTALGIPREGWPGLIQLGVLKTTQSEAPRVRDDDTEKYVYAWAARCETLTSTLRVLRASDPFRRVLYFTYSTSREISAVFRSDTFLPNINDASDIISPKVLLDLAQWGADLEKVVRAADDIRGDIWSVLLSCNTEKQLGDLLPEALKYLPERHETKALVPVEQVKALRKRLAEGVPTE